MSQLANTQPEKSVRASDSKRQNLFLTIVFWVVQVMLAVLFLLMGSMKIVTPVEVFLAQMAIPLPGLLIKFIGVAEVAGALGLIFPALLRIKPGLTPLAACGLIIIMIGAVTITVLGGDVVSALFPLVVGLLAAFIAYGRKTSLVKLFQGNKR